MARGVNRVILIGNLGQDPECRFMPSGGAVTNVTLATSEAWKDKNTGQMNERTEWHRIVFFNKLGEIAGEYLKKGSKVYIEGSIRTRKWEDQQGNTRYTTEIVATEMQMLDGRNDGSNQGNHGGHPAQHQGAQGQPNTNAHSQGQSTAHNGGGFAPPADDFSEDFPF